MEREIIWSVIGCIARIFCNNKHQGNGNTSHWVSNSATTKDN